jgi:hypothetical protein
MKRIGFLSFGHWTPSPQSQTRSASDALLQSIELAVAAEELGADGAYFRVHHFARQLASPFPLLAACGAKTKGIELGTAVIDMRYEIEKHKKKTAFVEYRGALFKRKASGGYEPTVYCPICHHPMGSLMNELPFNCARDKQSMNFTGKDLPGILRELEKEYRNIHRHRCS